MVPSRLCRMGSGSCTMRELSIARSGSHALQTIGGFNVIAWTNRSIPSCTLQLLTRHVGSAESTTNGSRGTCPSVGVPASVLAARVSGCSPAPPVASCSLALQLAACLAGPGFAVCCCTALSSRTPLPHKIKGSSGYEYPQSVLEHSLPANETQE